ncbi:MAG: hypothetical protein HYW90_03980 [Candidatus Sungbacteria bacterium]|nr:hypothetical protein [Candidatus Sungbacteria bacterium]
MGILIRGALTIKGRAGRGSGVDRRRKVQPVNYGPIAEKRVDQELAKLTADGEIDFWFRAPPPLDAEGIDHILGKGGADFIVWIVQVTSSKKKRRAYYRRLNPKAAVSAKLPYRRRQYYRYIPLSVVTRQVTDFRVRKKLVSISRGFKSVFENKHCPTKVKRMIADFLTAKGIAVPKEIFENCTPQ